MKRSWLCALGAAMVLAGCKRELSEAEAVATVETYLAKKIEAYRTGDYQIVEPYVGDAEAGKLLGLIGVKLDQGLTLDARILDHEVLGVERAKDEVVVLTDERWHYLDRRMGTGEQVGQDSTDRYRMKYVLVPGKKRWVVDRIEFAAAPEVGRSQVQTQGDAKAMHGLHAAPAPAEGK